MGFQPNPMSFSKEVFTPSAAIDITKHQVDIVENSVLTSLDIKPN